MGAAQLWGSRNRITDAAPGLKALDLKSPMAQAPTLKKVQCGSPFTATVLKNVSSY
jgi:hypothetical protein